MSKDSCAKGTDPLEGVVKYHATHALCSLEQALVMAGIHEDILPRLTALDNIRTTLHDARLIGVTPAGIGYGNCSIRLSETAFLISGSGTGAARVLGANGYGVVMSFDLETNTVHSAGPLQTSSEAMTHGSLYAARPEAGCVVHIHSEPLFTRLLAEHAPKTPRSAAYGTPALSRAMTELAHRLPSEAFLVTEGHAEGIFAYGADCASVLHTLLTLAGKSA